MRLDSSHIGLVLCCLPTAVALDLQVDAPASLRSAAATLTYNLLSIYTTNTTGTPAYLIGTLPQPLYWWHAGATWGAVMDYWAFSNDTTYVPAMTQALITQAGPRGDLMPQQFRGNMGNDDIAFWAFSVLSAAEYGLPFPNGGDAPAGLESWLQLSQRVFDGMVSRWDTATCGGGLRWQAYPENAGYNYKNAVSNGGFFLIAARLARYTGNGTYTEWAIKIWDWSSSINLVDRNNYAVYDGSDARTNCPELEQTQWTYNSALYLAGAAYLYNASAGGPLWGDRALNLLVQANRTFFGPFPNATDIMFEQACELRPRQTGQAQETTGAEGGCDQDQLLFKAFLGRWLGKAAILAPFLTTYIRPLLDASARGAAVACSGYVPSTGSDNPPTLAGIGINGSICAQHFYLQQGRVAQLSSQGYFNGLSVGQKVGHHISALEVIQANLPLVDTRREADGGPREIKVAPNVTTVVAPQTSVVLPSDLPQNTALNPPSAPPSAPPQVSSADVVIAAGRSRVTACLAMVALALLR